MKIAFWSLMISWLFFIGCRNTNSTKTDNVIKKSNSVRLALGYQSGWSELRCKAYTDSLKKLNIIETCTEFFAKENQLSFSIDHDCVELFNDKFKLEMDYRNPSKKKNKEMLYQIRLIGDKNEYYSEVNDESLSNFKTEQYLKRKAIFMEIVQKYNAKNLDNFECEIYDSVRVKLKIDSSEVYTEIHPTKRGIAGITDAHINKSIKLIKVKGLGMQLVIIYTDLKLKNFLENQESLENQNVRVRKLKNTRERI
jgi:hypothetical protein